MADASSLPYPYFDPSQTPAWLDAQRKQQMAQMLMGAIQQSNQTPENWDSMKVVPRRNPLQTVATLASALMAKKGLDASNQATAQYMQGLYGGGQGGAAAAPAETGPGPGIISPNASPDAQAAAQNVNAPGAGLPQPQAPVQQNPLIPAGMSRGTASGLIGMMGPQEYAKTLIAPQYVPLEIQRKLQAAGITDPNQQAAWIRQNLQKENYVAPIEQRQGSIERDPFTNQVIGQNPSLPTGGVNFYDAKGNLTGSGMAPGAADAISQSAAAQTAGTVSQTPQKVGVDAQGRDVFIYPTPPAMGKGGAPNAAQQGSGAAGAGTTASPAEVTGQQHGAEAGATYASTLASKATGATEVRRGISELRNLATQASPSAANERKMQAGALFIAAGVSPATVAKYLGVDVGALQASAHETGGLAINSIHQETNHGTNFDLQTFMSQNPNLNMADPAAFNRVADYIDTKAKDEIAKQKDFVQWKKGVPRDEWESGHTAHWLEKVNADIDAGRTNSTIPQPALQDLQAEAARRGLVVK